MSEKLKYAERKRKNEKKKINIDGIFVIFRDKVIKVQEETILHYVGFDVFSEVPYRIKKNPEAILLPQAVIKLIGCEKSRIQLADSLCRTRYDVCKLLNLSERTAYRMYNHHGLYEEEQRLFMTVPKNTNMKKVKPLVK